MKRILYFLLLAGTFAACTKEESGMVSGLVYSMKEGEPIAKENITVTLQYVMDCCSFPQPCSQKDSTQTDVLGSFFFTNLDKGSYTLYIEGEEPLRIELAPGAHEEVQFLIK